MTLNGQIPHQMRRDDVEDDIPDAARSQQDPTNSGRRTCVSHVHPSDQAFCAVTQEGTGGAPTFSQIRENASDQAFSQIRENASDQAFCQIRQEGTDRAPLLPEWLHRTTVRSHAVRVARVSRWHACFHSIRLPLYALRLTRRILRGAGVVARAVGRYIAAREYNAAIEAAKDADRALVLHQTRKGHRIRRTILLLIGTGVAVAALVWATPTLVLVELATGTGVGLALLGRKPDAPLLDETGAPATLVLAPDHLNAAFRAAGMLKPDTALTLCKPILQEGRGWAVLADLPMGGGKTAAHAIAKLDVLEAMGEAGRMHTDPLLARLVNLDEDTYGDYDAEQLAAELERAGVTRTMKQVKIDGANRAGYLRRDVEGAVPVEILETHRAERRQQTAEDALPDDEK